MAKRKANDSARERKAFRILGKVAKGKNCIHNKPVVAIKNNEKIIFFNIREASKITKAQRGHISGCCKGKRKTAGGYTWIYLEVGSVNALKNLSHSVRHYSIKSDKNQGVLGAFGSGFTVVSCVKPTAFGSGWA